MNAFQATELSSLLLHFAAEIKRVRFYSDLSALIDGQCWFKFITGETNDKITIDLVYYVGSFLPEGMNDDNFDDDFIISSDAGKSYLYIPEKPDGITEYKNTYSHDYAVETITDIMDKAMHCLERIEAARDAFNRRTAPYYEPNSIFA